MHSRRYTIGAFLDSAAPRRAAQPTCIVFFMSRQIVIVRPLQVFGALLDGFFLTLQGQLTASLSFDIL